MEFDPIVLSLHETGLNKPATRNPLHLAAESKEGQPKHIFFTVNQALSSYSA
jgi:hypothetical protein